MKHIVVGLGEHGRSTVVDVREIAVDADGRFTEVLWTTECSPPELAVPHRGPDDETLDLGVRATGTRWFSVRRGPGPSPVGMHRTDTLDYQLVVEGEATLILEDGEIVMQAGDSVVIPGLPHGWAGGPEGYTMHAVLLGFPVP